MASFDNAGDFTTANLTYPGPGSPETLPATSMTSFGIGPSFATQADMDAAYPFGTYVIAVSGGSQPDTMVTLDYSADAYAPVTPQLAQASFDALLGLNTGLNSLTLNFNSYTPSALTTAAYTFFSIFGSSQGCTFLLPSSTSCTIDPQALTPGTTYVWELDFTSRIEGNQDGALTYTDFDVRTDGVFTTAAAAAPEASTWVMVVTGFAGLAFAANRRRPARVD